MKRHFYAKRNSQIIKYQQLMPESFTLTYSARVKNNNSVVNADEVADSEANIGGGA